MTNGIVLELQRDCLSSSQSITGLLRKAKVIASKLGLDDLGEWIDSELSGYECAAVDLPRHRIIGGSPKFWNPYNGWCPIMTDDPNLSEILHTVYLFQSVSSLEDLANNESGFLTFKYPDSIQSYLRKNGDFFNFEAVAHISNSSVISVLDFVRNKLLDWTLALERKGINGDGYTFNESQKQEAQAVTNYIYGGNIGVLGHVSGDANNSKFYNSNGLDTGAIRNFLNQARQASNGLDPDLQEKVVPLLETLESQTRDNVKEPVVRKTLNSLKSVLEGASGNIVAQAILSALS